MGMNPETNHFEELQQIGTLGEEQRAEFRRQCEELGQSVEDSVLVRPDGSPVPKHWSVFSVGELVVIKDYTFRVAYIGEKIILFEPVGLVLDKEDDDSCRSEEKP